MRLPPILPADLNPTQKVLYDDICAGVAKRFDAFETVDAHGSLIGPFNASINYPEVGTASWNLTKAVNAMANLPPGVKEVAILVVGGFFRASYEIYAHSAVAESLGMTLQRISELVANIKPPDLRAEESVAFDVAYSLCRGGPMAEATWKLAISAFGKAGAAQLVYLVAIYAFVSVSLNGFDVPVPAGQ